MPPRPLNHTEIFFRQSTTDIPYQINDLIHKQQFFDDSMLTFTRMQMPINSA